MITNDFELTEFWIVEQPIDKMCYIKYENE